MRQNASIAKEWKVGKKKTQIRTFTLGPHSASEADVREMKELLGNIEAATSLLEAEAVFREASEGPLFHLFVDWGLGSILHRWRFFTATSELPDISTQNTTKAYQKDHKS